MRADLARAAPLQGAEQRRVEADLEHIAAEVRRADPALKALVLTGSFARGEGAVLRGKAVNDYDLVPLRGLGRPREPYPALRARLSREVGVAVDLEPLWWGRLRWVRPSIFWYETALRGRVLFGPADALQRIPVRRVDQLDRTEGLRLLVNRAAGLLLGEGKDPQEVRLQAAKALLAALDVHLLARGFFAPSQRERWALYERFAAAAPLPPTLGRRAGWLAWAMRYKLEPGHAEPRRPALAWKAGAAAVLDAVPVALGTAGLPDLDAYADADLPLENALYRVRAGRVTGARRWALHPTGQVRAATLELLAARLGRGDGAAAMARLRALVPDAGARSVAPLLADLRNTTAQ